MKRQRSRVARNAPRHQTKRSGLLRLVAGRAGLFRLSPPSQRRKAEPPLTRCASGSGRRRERCVRYGGLGSDSLDRWRGCPGDGHVGHRGRIETHAHRPSAAGRRVGRRRRRRYSRLVSQTALRRSAGTYAEALGVTEEAGRVAFVRARVRVRQLATRSILAGCRAGWRSGGSGRMRTRRENSQTWLTVVCCSSCGRGSRPATLSRGDSDQRGAARSDLARNSSWLANVTSALPRWHPEKQEPWSRMHSCPSALG